MVIQPEAPGTIPSPAPSPLFLDASPRLSVSSTLASPAIGRVPARNPCPPGPTPPRRAPTATAPDATRATTAATSAPTSRGRRTTVTSGLAGRLRERPVGSARLPVDLAAGHPAVSKATHHGEPPHVCPASPGHLQPCVRLLR